MRIPLLSGGRAKRASSADFPSHAARFLRFQPTPKFRNPLPHPVRVAVVRVKLSGANLRVFQPSEGEAIQSFRPGILAGTLAALRRVSVPVPVTKAVVVFSDAKFPHIAPAERDWLWQRFQVPCFEQVLNSGRQVIAEECQVHAGLHVLRPEQLSGMLCSVECDCGRTEPRLLAPALR